MVSDTIFSMKKRSKEVRNIALAVIGALLFLTFVIPVSFIPYDNWMFNSFSGQLFSLPELVSPALETKQDFGSLISNGDHCDIFAALLIKYDGPENDLNNYYRLYIQHDHPTKPLPEIFRVSDFRGKVDFLSDPLLPAQLYAKDIQSRYPQEDWGKLYIVYIFAPDYVSGIGDLRCG